MQPVDDTAVLPGVPAGAGMLRAWEEAMHRALVAILTRIGYRLNRTLPKDGSEAMTGPLALPTYTVATLPAASSHPAAVVHVSDGGAGAVFRGSNGSAWVNLG